MNQFQLPNTEEDRKPKVYSREIWRMFGRKLSVPKIKDALFKTYAVNLTEDQIQAEIDGHFDEV